MTHHNLMICKDPVPKNITSVHAEVKASALFGGDTIQAIRGRSEGSRNRVWGDQRASGREPIYHLKQRHVGI